MSYYRIYRFPLRNIQNKHIYFKYSRFSACPVEHKPGQGVEVIGRLPENLIRARRTVRDLILCNPFNLFCTFTFAADKLDRNDLGKCSKRIRELFKNYRNRYAPDFRYIIIPEYHKNGAIHFHGMVSGIRPEDLKVPDLIPKRGRGGVVELVPNTRRYVDWPYYSQKLGFFSCSKVRNYTACARYVSKYITKDLEQLPKGLNVYMCSQGLRRPELVFDCDDVPCLFQPQHDTKYCSIAYLPDVQTIGQYLPDWYGECASDLSDPPEDDDGLEPRMTFSQLKLWGAPDIIPVEVRKKQE